MKILVAGATGAIGFPLMHLLAKRQDEIFGITQSTEKALTLAGIGAKPLILNVLDREAVLSAVRDIRPDIIVDMLTHLPKEYTPEAMRQAAVMDAKIRSEGGSNLLSAGEACGAKRYMVQSSGFFYAPGKGLADESSPLAVEASPGVSAAARLYTEIEKRVLQSKLEGVALRFGFFYGPGTWFHPEGNMAEQVRKQQFPLVGHGQGIWNFVHIEDAAKAIVLALKSPSGIYNIVNDRPSPLSEWLPAFAQFVGAKQPPHITEEEGLKLSGPDAVYYATRLRGASNAKAKKELNFLPRPFEWF